VGKVKKRGRVRKVSAKKQGQKKRVPSGAKKQMRAGQSTRRKAGKRIVKRRGVLAAKRANEGATAPTYRIRELDPVAKCGPGTSVQRLYRIDEIVDGDARPHLVFLDRHGWYCEHGRDCPAVSQVRKSGDGARQHGPNNNGRMRA